MIYNIEPFKPLSKHAVDVVEIRKATELKFDKNKKNVKWSFI